MSDLVSIIIPTYNYAHFLGATLRSALAQKNISLEILVVDDGSTDETQACIAQFFPKITLLSQENKGLSAARNAGLARATGRYVVFLDADDLLGPDALSSQLRQLQADPTRTMVVCRNRFFTTTDAAGQPIACGEWRLFRDDLAAHLCHFNIAPPHAFLARREAVERAGGFDTELAACEDYDLWFRLAVAGPPPAVNPAGLVAYRRHPGSMSRNLDRQYTHDACMHRRVARRLLQSDFPNAARLEGLLGCLAGCVLTLERLAPRQPEAAKQLVPVIGDLLQSLDREAPTATPTPTSQYFLLRLALTLQHAHGDAVAVIRPIHERLHRLLAQHLPALAANNEQHLRTALEQLTATLVF